MDPVTLGKLNGFLLAFEQLNAGANYLALDWHWSAPDDSLTAGGKGAPSGRASVRLSRRSAAAHGAGLSR
jgi:hypothetical protein